MTPDQCDHSALIRAGYRLRQGLAGRERDRLLGESADLETHCWLQLLRQSALPRGEV